MSDFSTNLKRLREKAGLTRSELATAANVSNNAIGYYEIGKREPHLSTLMLLASALHVSTDELLGYHVDEYYLCVRYIENDCDLIFSEIKGFCIIAFGTNEVYKVFPSRKEFINFVSASRKNFLDSSLYIDSARTSLLADIAREKTENIPQEIESEWRKPPSSGNATHSMTITALVSDIARNLEKKRQGR